MIVIDHVSKRFGNTEALTDCTLTIEEGAFFVLVGPSGCGKSTLLRTINGLIRPEAGSVRLRGRDILDESQDRLRQRIGYVIQSVGLFPHWSIGDNIDAVPRLLRWDAKRIARRRQEIVDLLRIDPALLPRFPHELSGGQRQRVGVARAFAAEPDLVLMDEPFSALDPVSRATLQGETRRIHAQSKTTIVMVTHDVAEAASLASAVAVMREGRIVQTGAPAAVIAAPADDFVADFLGGSERFLHLLDGVTVGQAMATGTAPDRALQIAPSASLRAALGLMMAAQRTELLVVDAERAVGRIDLAAIVTAARG